MTFKRGDMVVLRLNGRHIKDCRVIATYPEFHSAVRVERDNVEYLTTPDHLETLGDYEDRKAKERVAQERQKYASLIDAWEKGYRTTDALAKHLGLESQRGLAARVKAAKRRNFLK